MVLSGQDKSWIGMDKTSVEFAEGFKNFLTFAYEHGTFKGRIKCPCTVCYCRWLKDKEEIEMHVMINGFTVGYTVWYDHGETISLPSSTHLPSSTLPEPSFQGDDNMRGLLQDIFVNPYSNIATDDSVDPIAEPFEDRAYSFDDNHFHTEQDTAFPENIQVPYKRLLSDMDEELYPGCQKYSKLSFTLHLLHLKYMFGWPTKSFTMLLDLFLDAFPNVTTFPKSFYEAKKVLKDLGLGYQKIHACPKDCMLFWDFVGNKPIEDEVCKICGRSRWKEPIGLEVSDNLLEEVDPQLPKKSKKAAKILRYFPLIPRFKRLYVSPKTAEDMLWHDKHRVKDEKLRHPADGLAWKEFDNRYSDFASDPRNIRLGLASDGFNPFGTLSTSHSTWPVVLFVYNLPPWLCMKRSSLIMSMIIPGPQAPGNKIDTYLQRLIAELNEMWKGVDVYDSLSGKSFTLRAALMWTINDFPAYANLSGWSTKGKFACPCCCEKTDSLWLRNGKKFCYMGHRRLLPLDHPFREQAALFDGSIEQRVAPLRKSGTDVLEEMERSETRKNGEGGTTNNSGTHHHEYLVDDDPLNHQHWKKRSIFFDLPYWEHQLLRHNLDGMHIEKNVTKSLTNTFTSFDKKSKDNENARKDLVELNLKHNLHPVTDSSGKVRYPAALYTMSKAEKELFLKVIQDLKVPDGYASNISRCVNMKERRLMNMKSHDYHILMQDILPIALRASMQSEILELVVQLSYFFKGVCAREIDVGEIDKLQSLIILLLCKMEKVFPPGFFTIMIHLMVYLPEEIKLGGPIAYRWMYPVERSLGDFKSDVGNKTHPEGCIAEGTIAKECLIHCAQYFGQEETIFNRRKRNEDYIDNSQEYFSNTSGRPDGKVEIIDIKDRQLLAQAHRYVLLHFQIVETYRRDFLREKRSMHGRGRVSTTLETKWLAEEFSNWFERQVQMLNDTVDHYSMLLTLARGPNNTVKKMKGFITRGYRFRAMSFDHFRSTQNCGVSVVTNDNNRWYGKIREIYELDYFGAFKVVLFKCMWVDLRPNKGLKKDKNGFVLVNFSRLIHTGVNLKDDPFILSSEADQVFYVPDGKDPHWSHAVLTKPRDTFQTGHDHRDEDEEEETHPVCVASELQTSRFDGDINLCRHEFIIDDVAM